MTAPADWGPVASMQRCRTARAEWMDIASREASGEYRGDVSTAVALARSWHRQVMAWRTKDPECAAVDLTKPAYCRYGYPAERSRRRKWIRAECAT